jgi:predicted aspartyl protease
VALALATTLLTAQAPSAIDVEVQLQLGDLLAADGRFAGAAKAYRLARDQAEGPARVRAGQGLVAAMLRTAAFREARKEAAALVGDARRHPAALALEGDALWAAGLFDEAEASYEASLAGGEVDPRALSGLARALAARGRFDDALAAAERAAAIAPANPEPLSVLGYVYERMRRYPEAADALSTFNRLLPPRERADRGVIASLHARFLRDFAGRTPLAVSEAAAAQVHVVPFRLERDKIVIDGRINGRRVKHLVVDTGAEMTVVTQKTAVAAGIVPVIRTLSAGVGEMGLRGLPLARLRSIEIGTLRVDDVPAIVRSPALEGLPVRETDSVSPLALGFSMTVDYARRLLTISRSLSAEPGGVTLPLRMHRLAFVQGQVNHDRVPFVVDTGGEVISISRATFRALGAVPPRHIALRVYGASGWDPTAFLMPGLDLAFEDVRLPRHSVVVLDLDAPSALLGFEVGGIVGHKFLSRYRLSIDLARSEVRLGTL